MLGIVRVMNFAHGDLMILASYMTHGLDRLMRWRISSQPESIEAWSEEYTVDAGADLSYSNLFMLRGEQNRIYNFHRGVGWNPNFMISDDLGKSFCYGGRLLNWPRPEKGEAGYSGLGGGRPYLKYASDGISTIHFITTEDHPRAFDNSIFHGFIRMGKVYGSDGKELHVLSPDRWVDRTARGSGGTGRRTRRPSRSPTTGSATCRSG